MNKSTDVTPALGTDSPQPFLNKEFRLLNRYELQADLVEALGKTRHNSHLVAKVGACHKSFRGRNCINSSSLGCRDWAKPFNSCSVRVCPHCAHRRAELLGARFEAALLGRDGLRYMVLSERNCSSYEEGRALLWYSWTRLRRSVCWKTKVKGCIVAEEVTYNADDKTWHPHLNVLAEGEYFPQEELKKAWMHATDGRGEIVWIAKANSGTVRELIKYVAKVVDLLERPEVLDEFLNATKGRRLLRTYGTHRGISIADEENPGEQEKCPDCGSDCFVDTGFLPGHQVSFDFEKGEFRVNRKGREVDDALRRTVEFYPQQFEASTLPRPRTILDHELARFHALISKLASSARREIFQCESK